MGTDRSWSRRQLLQGALGVGAAAVGVSAATAGTGWGRKPDAVSTRLPPRSQWRRPGSLPNPKLPEGADTLPEIDHIVVVMQENHSFANNLGMLARGHG